MKKLFLVCSLSVMMASCSIFQPRIPYEIGMEESKFLRQNRSAVLNQLDGETKVYRVTRDDGFYILATFQNGKLTRFEERELAPVWQQQRMMDPNKQ
ncbi:MAG TPA: hypothetical protein VKZ51_01200 [Cyclobacteriaceae bacterium]|nr:hypothetical protein [Cyclobacteriaceae bacterium]